MALRSSTLAARLIAMAAGVAMLAGTASCGVSPSSEEAAGESAATSRSDAGTAMIFTPADGITISQRTPSSKWAKLVPQITGKLVDGGMAKRSIGTKTSSDLDEQSRDVQDWVVDHITADGSSSSNDDDAATAKRTTLIVAPAVASDSATRQYGDYVTQPDGADDASTDGETAETRLSSALQLAHDSGMHVILLANGVAGFTPDAFVRFSTAQSIGAVQASKLVAKLDLAKASKDNPKSIEVIIPRSSDAADDNDEDGDGERDDAFAREAFAGVWKVLRPYFSAGKAYSPSGLLDAASTDDDWAAVTVDAGDERNVATALDERLPKRKTADGTSRTRIDGVIAMNDYVASAVTDELDALGYTGSAADINPQITISGIVGNIAGRKDLQRGSVPDPAKAPEKDSSARAKDEADATGAEEINSRWPIVTGFGVYVDTMPQVVNGKQWMTGLENRMALAADTAETAVRLNRGESLDKLSYVSKGTVPGTTTKTHVVEEDLLAVSASNLKAALIDPGYISMADAGL